MNPDPVIIPRLYQRQEQRGGYLTADDMHQIAEGLNVPLYRVQALVSFFPLFRTSPPPKVQVNICRDMSCHLRGSLSQTESLSSWAKEEHGDQVVVCGVSCLGRCDRAIAAMINDHLYVQRDESELKSVIDSHVAGEPVAHDTDRALTDQTPPQWQMDVYEGPSSYDAVKAYLREPKPERIVGNEGALTVAGLLGMGGAGGRAYKKWGDVHRAKGREKYIVCNADESEPGTFKDREIMLAKPHLTVEGMIVAGLVVGASRGWFYVRHEYHEQVESIEAEIKRARCLGALGANVFNSGRNFDIDVFVSPGGYICGEQTALIETMEDKRAEPRIRPPELMTNGYRNQPTLLSNVETFAWVPAILLKSWGQWFAKEGIKMGPLVGNSGSRMKGRRLFSISGDVAKPGVYEVPTGIPLGQLIDQFAGGMRDNKEIVAVALSGPSGGLLPARIPVKHLKRGFVEANLSPEVTDIDVRDIPLDISVSRVLGIMIGAGLVVYGTGADVMAESLACSRFFRNESCGKCVPCRIGSTKITEMGERIAAGKNSVTDLPILEQTMSDLGRVMIDTSICGLGKVASNPMVHLLKFFPELVSRTCLDNGQDQGL